MVRRPHVIGFVILAVSLAGLVGVTGGMSGTQATGYLQPAAVDAGNVSDSTPDGFSRTSYTLTVYENGTVRWTTIHSRPLNESEVPAFESYAEEFNNTEMVLYREFVAQAESLAATGTQSTNRTMNATNFRKHAQVARGGFNLGTQGKVEMSFLWTNLASVEGEQVVFGEAFDVGLYLGPNQRLTIQPGPGLVFASVDPGPDSQDDPDSQVESEWIAWEGEYEFNPERPLVTFQPAGRTMTTTQTVSTAATTTPTTSVGPTTSGQSPTTAPVETSADDGIGGMFVVGLIVLLLTGGTVALYRTVISADDDGEGGVPPSTPPSDDSGAAAETPTEAEGSDEPATTVTDEELLSDTDRVASLLESHGGRMRQSAIVEETDWSKSKVSMLLSDMEEDDEITKLRVGRENIISLPGHEPDAAGSPFEDEE